MNIKKIIKEEMDDSLDWIKNIKSGIMLNANTYYIIDCCDYGYDETLLRNKLIELFGDISYKYINWFNNQYVQELNNRCKLFLKFNKSKKIIQTGWDSCSNNFIENSYKPNITVTLEEFLNSYLR